jgi:hypothetical protein
MAVLGFPSCDSVSYTTPDIKGQLDKRRESISQRFTKNQEEPKLASLLFDPSTRVGRITHIYSSLSIR